MPRISLYAYGQFQQRRDRSEFGSKNKRMSTQDSGPPASYTTSLFQSLRTNQLSPETTSWLARILHALDSKDVAAYCSFMSPEVTITFNNGGDKDLGPNMRGIDAVQKGLAAFWQGFKSVRHEELNIYGTDRAFAHEALNHYETLDGREVSVRAVAFVDRDEEGRIEALRIYNDQSPVWGLRNDRA